jgi:hypothetical protein
MFRRKLLALDYHSSTETFTGSAFEQTYVYVCVCVLLYMSGTHA